MKEQRSALQSWLADSQTTCQDSVVLQSAIEETQSSIGLEVAGWDELMADLASVERKVQELAHAVRSIPVEPGTSGPGPNLGCPGLWYPGRDPEFDMHPPTTLW